MYYLLGRQNQDGIWFSSTCDKDWREGIGRARTAPPFTPVLSGMCLLLCHWQGMADMEMRPQSQQAQKEKSLKISKLTSPTFGYIHRTTLRYPCIIDHIICQMSCIPSISTKIHHHIWSFFLLFSSSYLELKLKARLEMLCALLHPPPPSPPPGKK